MPNLHQLLETPGLISMPPLSGPSSMSIKSSTPAPDSWRTSDRDEPPMHMVERLIDSFLLYSSDWGFFLDPARFRREALLPLPLGHPSRPCPALLAAVYLAGASLSDTTHEETFLARALSALPTSLSGLHPRRTLHVLQAQVLLANYFFAARRFLQGKYHTAAAVSLAMGSGLQMDRRTPQVPGDPVEEGERLDACLATFTLDKAWAAALGEHSNWSGIPWPLERVEHSTYSTETGTPSPKTFLAKAAMFWERANTLGVCWKSDMGIHESREFSNAFGALDESIEDFWHAVALSSDQSHNIEFACSIAHVAAIQLHTPFVSSSGQSKQKCIDASTAVLHAIPNTTSTSRGAYINPIIAPVWGTAFGVALDEIRSGGGDSELVAVFERGFAGIRAFAGSSPLMDFHIEKIQDARSAR
ncbi:hypothetical protein B0H17DRAFT_294632 [Mycena rosella]|uniref:Transcription factor domain-containing protein n=1 Tax=Mycena rosella TaxID=1033263 RepID=A0AAD7G4E3_MYCRO|nr:hypothetical protein B0H17DRAFT_294632 [Mycena rosella]